MESGEQLLERFRARPQGEQMIEALIGSDAWLVGGAVRDLILGREPLDLDVTIEGDALAVARGAATRLGGKTILHDRFETATVETPGVTFDVARARRERYPRPGALPEVQPATVDDDLLRRDFTVNAIALCLEDGELRAAPSAFEDLDAHLMRVLHEKSFEDDPTRLLRLVRYSARLSFTIETGTERLARDAIGKEVLTNVTGARIGDELRLLLGEETAQAALDLAAELGLDRALHPSLAWERPIAERALALVPEDGRRDLLLFAICCRQFARTELTTWLDELEFTASERDTIVAAALDAEPLARRLDTASRPSEIWRAASARGLEQLALAGALGPAEPARSWLDDLRHVRLEISGDDLIAAGLPEGPAIGKALDHALALKLDGEVEGREAELQAALGSNA